MAKREEPVAARDDDDDDDGEEDRNVNHRVSRRSCPKYLGDFFTSSTRKCKLAPLR
jgi:hypothetical protein